ncbi:MAG TPA: hypothetical protein VFD92_08520 [Candidatus Binatia bacterium]|nr:hypothetical protein [Candidatus Binatia bacterium]
MKKILVGAAVMLISFAAQARAGTFFGALSNFDAVNDTGSTCHGFEIELDDIHSQDVTYTFQFQRYGIPKITEDTYLDPNNVSHPRTFVRWMSTYDQVAHVFTQRTLPAAAGFMNTGGHLCFGANVVNGSPYDLAGCEHFGLGTLKNPSNTVYRWMQEDPATPGNLIALGNPVTIPAPVWTVPAGPNPVVAAVIPVPPPPAVVPVPYEPNAEFGVAVWAKVFETESPDKADLDHLTSDDPAVPGNDGPVPNPNAVTEIEWQILQTDSMNPTVNELKSERPLGNGNESVTRRYEFYQYVGQYDVGPPGGEPGTNEALCPNVAADGVHGTVSTTGGLDCSGMVVVGNYIGAQNAAVDVGLPLSANGAQLNHGEVGVQYPDRPLIFGGSGGPYSVFFSGPGTLPATDPGNEFTLDAVTGVLHGGTPNGTGLATFDIHATDLADPSQPPLAATFNILVVPAVAVDDIAIPNGTAHVATAVNLTASGGETPFTWSIVSHSPTLQASVVGNTLSLTAPADGLFSVELAVADSLGGTNSRSLSYNVGGVAGCGDHAVEAGEQCDDGAENGTLASCCTADCHFKSIGTICADDGNACTVDACDGASAICQHSAGNPGAVCRPSQGVCDIEETCDGASPDCPGNAFEPGTVVCGVSAGPCDVAATCSGADPSCPPNGTRPDSDGDGQCDAIDVCTNVAGGQNFVATNPKPKLMVGNVNNDTVPDNDKFNLSGAFVIAGAPPFSSIDPITNGARVIIKNGSGIVRIDAVVPGGALTGHGTRGWKLSKSGKNWTYDDLTGSLQSGITSVRIIDKSQITSKNPEPGRVQVTVKGMKSSYPVVAADDPLNGAVILGGQSQAEAGYCGETTFGVGNCVFNHKGTAITCKP